MIPAVSAIDTNIQTSPGYTGTGTLSFDPNNPGGRSPLLNVPGAIPVVSSGTILESPVVYLAESEINFGDELTFHWAGLSPVTAVLYTDIQLTKSYRVGQFSGGRGSFGTNVPPGTYYLQISWVNSNVY